jgi:hypothetical protein
MANLQVKDAAASTKYLSASGAGTDLDPHVVEHLDSNSAAMLTALQAIQTAVELLDNMISGSEGQVDVVSSALPTGAATEATLAAIQTAVELIDNMISGSEAQVDVVTSALPTGAATEATLGAIQTAVELIDNMISGSEGQVDVVSSALPTGAATETTLAAVQTAVEAIQTAVELIDNTVSGTELQVDVLSSALPTGAATEATLGAIQTATEAIQTSAETLDNIVSGSEAQVDVVAALPAGTNQIGDVVVNDIEDGAGTSVMDTGNNAVKVNVVAGSGSGVSHTDDAAFTAGTDDVVPAAGVYQSSPDQVDDGDAGALRMTQRRTLLVSHETPAGDSMVDDANDALQVNVVAGSGSGVTHTDDAAFTVGTDDVVPAAGIYRSTPDPVDDGDAGALAMSSDRELFVQVRDAAGNDRGLNVDASGNVGVTDAGGALTVDGTVTADAGTGPWPVTDNGGALTVDQPTPDNLNCNANLQIGDSDVGAGNPVPISDNGGAITVDGTVTADAGTGPWPVTDNGSTLSVDDGDSTLSVDDGGGALTVDGTVTADAGTGPWPVTDNSGSLTVDDGGTALEMQGDAAEDAAAAGNPVLVGGRYNASPGSADGVDDGDAVRMLCDLIGGVVKGYHPGGWTAQANYSTAQTDASVKAAPGAGLSLYVTDILFSTDTAMNFFLESSSTTYVPKVYLAANGGWSAHFQTPIKWPANTAITITSSAAGNHSIMINGYTAP